MSTSGIWTQQFSICRNAFAQGKASNTLRTCHVYMLHYVSRTELREARTSDCLYKCIYMVTN